MRGQRLLVVTITPFSVEKESVGRPCMFQSFTDVGLPRNVANEKSGLQGMSKRLICKCSSKPDERSEVS